MPSFVVLSPQRALFASGGLFELDLNSGEIVSADNRHTPCEISSDGDTIAVSNVDSLRESRELGLSLDAGKSFTWTQHGNLVRCQESRVVASGEAGLASCVSGVERWTGSGTPLLMPYSAPKLFGSGAHVVIGSAEAIHLSEDSGAHFSARTFAGIPSSGSLLGIVGNMIYALGRAEDQTSKLYAAHWSEPFEAI
jgi:hypothetical protein